MLKRLLPFVLILLLGHGLAMSKVYVGPSFFRPDDDIIIKQVATSSLDFKPGDKVIVRGIYRLNSRPAAKIGLFLTNPNNEDSTRSPKQMKLIHSGRGEFELKIVIPAEGYLHLSFYPGDAGRSFGGRYFGSREQMSQIANWDLRKHLDY